MTVLTRFEPFREFSNLQDRINRVFRESYAPAGQDESLLPAPPPIRWLRAPATPKPVAVSPPSSSAAAAQPR